MYFQKIKLLAQSFLDWEYLLFIKMKKEKPMRY